MRGQPRSGNLDSANAPSKLRAWQLTRVRIVLMRLENAATRTVRSVFDEFAAPEEYSFAKTIVPVRLAQYEGEKLASRSQAKRLYQRFERIRHVVLDFDGVAEIGQGFADEVFRVFAVDHPAVVLAPINMTREVARSVRRAQGPLANEGSAGLRPPTLSPVGLGQR